MEKRLNRTDYVFAVTFIFMLVVALGAFFYGLQLGQQRASAKYEELLVKQTEQNGGFAAYHQQYLVSFYHTIYQPYREFHKAWFDKLDQLQSNRASDASLLLKELAKQSQAVYNDLQQKSTPASSPLLQEAHKDYMKSLKLFSEALPGFASRANAMPSGELIAQLQSDAYLTEARNFAMKAENEYYSSIIKWAQTSAPPFKEVDVTKPISVQEWGTLTLNMKNAYITSMLLAGKRYQAFTPQDLSGRIDDMIAAGQAKKMNLSDIGAVADMLIATDAVREGDFLRVKGKLYANETLPQLPFFTN
ncbi:hypothetical protein SAMN02799630_00467 [Paenibacillus sp. UNCCL117]|uniref:hypothetical protein n=1 Tax=unclassified Paenibacillus TaxID=185978 RepID=UPI00088933A4|nr:MULTISPECIES: hypothetical protein [unclassified Paenibacillus]SDC39286.1 hypothetical protein SAMN04488602_10265 [Paenibacillus sp. cl123]SFW14148.1 hypothetical protein SAMN02799630_00467 [Paenibacillus sp. UNCCL117]